MRDLYERVLADPSDAPSWRKLVVGFAEQGRVERAAVCLDAAEAAEGAGSASPTEAASELPWAAQELRRAAGRKAIERSAGLRAGLCEGDDYRISVIVSGEPGASDTERTLASLAEQTPEAGSRQLLVDPDRGRALRLARGRYVACVDAGDELWPDHLALLAGHLDRTGRALTHSQALRPGPHRPSATEAGPFLPRQASREEFAPSSCVLVRRRELLAVGGFDPALGRAQSWQLSWRFVERLAADAVPVLSAQVRGDDVSPERRFDLLLVRRAALARARRQHRHARRHLERGDPDLAAKDLGRAWNLGLDVERYVPAVAAVAEQARPLAADLVALAGREIAPHVRGGFLRIAKGADARRELAVRMHRHALRTRYASADRRGRERAHSLGWTGDA